MLLRRLQLSANEVHALTDALDSEKGSPPAQALRPQRCTMLVGYIKRKAEGRKAKKDEETAPDKAARSTVRATWVIAGFTVILALVSYNQLREMQNTGVESGGQMNQMIEKYRQQVAQVSRQADQTRDLAEQMKTQAAQTKIIAEQARVQANATISAANTAQSTLDISQGAYVTIGRKDGTVADFIIPKDPAQDAEIVIYFQNSGHLPAKFRWGTMAPLLGAGSRSNSSGITYTHPYKGQMFRTRDIKSGSIGEQGESSTIAGDSVFVSTLGTISQQNIEALSTNTISLFILGHFEYCDQLGHHEMETFGLRYRSNAPSTDLSFDLAMESIFPSLPLPKPSAITEYLPPCDLTAKPQAHHGGQHPNPN